MASEGRKGAMGGRGVRAVFRYDAALCLVARSCLTLQPHGMAFVFLCPTDFILAEYSQGPTNHVIMNSRISFFTAE